MAGLSIMGIEIPCERDGVSIETDVVGVGLDRAQDGSPRNNFNAMKTKIVARSTPLIQNDALFLGAMLRGLGDHWTFNSGFYSDKGAGWNGAPTVPTGLSIVGATPTPKYGAGAMQIDASALHSIVFPVNSLAKGWTLAFWYSQGAGAWNHYILTGSGGSYTTCEQWLNGSYSGGGALPLGISLTASSITFTGSGSFTRSFDDLLFVPARVSNIAPKAVASQLYTFMAAQAIVTPYPGLTVSGDVLPVSLQMFGKLNRSTNMMGALGGSFYDNLRKLEFELWE